MQGKEKYKRVWEQRAETDRTRKKLGRGQQHEDKSQS